MSFFFALAYILVGILLAIPYCLLAGWNPDNFLLVAYVAPAFLLIWGAIAGYAGVMVANHRRPGIYFNWRAAFSKNSRRRYTGSSVIFWIWTLYCLLPIILRWSAVLLEKVGYESVSAALNTHRYASNFYIFIAAIVLLVLIGMLLSAWESAKKIRWARLMHR